MATFGDELNGSLGCIFLVGLFSLMCVAGLQCSTSSYDDANWSRRLYGCTCGQVMYYLTHYFSSETGGRAYITKIVRIASFACCSDTDTYDRFP